MNVEPQNFECRKDRLIARLSLLLFVVGMGGSLSVESKKHRGSTFTVSFPRMEVAAPTVPVRPEDTAPVRRPHTRPRVLVVDYAREAQGVVQHFLQAAYAVEAVPNAKAAPPCQPRHSTNAFRPAPPKSGVSTSAGPRTG